MFKQFLASVGIGSATVDTKLTEEIYYPGGTIAGVIVLQGGQVEQRIQGLELALMTRAEVETEDAESFINYCLQSWRIPETFLLEPQEVKEVPFSYRLLDELPITEVSTKHSCSQVWLQTGVSIDFALDPQDQDYLRVNPTPLMENLLEAVQDLGFQLIKTDVGKGYINTSTTRTTSGCYQEFEFRPKRMNLGIKEIELSFIPDQSKLQVLFEVDRRLGGDQYQCLSFDTDESNYDAIKAAVSLALDH